MFTFRHIFLGADTCTVFTNLPLHISPPQIGGLRSFVAEKGNFHPILHKLQPDFVTFSPRIADISELLRIFVRLREI